MDKNEEFLKFAKVNEELGAVIETWDPKKL